MVTIKQRKAKFLAAVAASGLISQAMAAIGISSQEELFAWCRRDPNFHAAILAAHRKYWGDDIIDDFNAAMTKRLDLYNRACERLHG
jgi:hypothetical protein